MSKVDLVAGRRRGSVGLETYSNINGQGVVKAKVTTSVQPNTSQQIVQKAVFLNAVTFYKRAVQNLYQFAYEDKKKVESYYNAFMRHNVKNAIMVTKEMAADPIQPSIGNFLMSQGSLMMIRPEWEDYFQAYINFMGYDGVIRTIGDLSLAFINRYGYKQGDYVTFVRISTSATSLTASDSESKPSFIVDYDELPPQWWIRQIKLDVNSTQILEVVGLSYNQDSNMLVIGEDLGNEVIAFVAVVASRKTDSKLYVSTSYLIPNPPAQEAFKIAATEKYNQAILDAWGVTSNILQGSIVEDSIVFTLIRGLADTAVKALQTEGVLQGRQLSVSKDENQNSLWVAIEGEGIDKFNSAYISCTDPSATAFTSYVQNGVAYLNIQRNGTDVGDMYVYYNGELLFCYVITAA